MNPFWQKEYIQQLHRYRPAKEKQILKAFPWLRKPYLLAEERQVPKMPYLSKPNCEHDRFQPRAEHKPLITSTPAIVPILTAMARLKPEQFPYVDPQEAAEIDLCEILLYLILNNDVPRLRALYSTKEQVDPENRRHLSSHFFQVALYYSSTETVQYLMEWFGYRDFLLEMIIDADHPDAFAYHLSEFSRYEEKDLLRLADVCAYQGAIKILQSIDEEIELDWTELTRLAIMSNEYVVLGFALSKRLPICRHPLTEAVYNRTKYDSYQRSRAANKALENGAKHDPYQETIDCLMSMCDCFSALDVKTILCNPDLRAAVKEKIINTEDTLLACLKEKDITSFVDPFLLNVNTMLRVAMRQTKLETFLALAKLSEIRKDDLFFISVRANRPDLINYYWGPDRHLSRQELLDCYTPQNKYCRDLLKKGYPEIEKDISFLRAIYPEDGFLEGLQAGYQLSK